VSTYILNRLAQAVIVALIVSVVVFLLVRLKGDPIELIAPPEFTQEQIQGLRVAWGLDKPLNVQYAVFLSRAVKGDFGDSMRSKRPAIEFVLDKLPFTFLLAGVSAILALLISVPLGVLSAVRRGSFIDLFSTSAATVGAAMPNFWIGLMLILFFSVNLRLLPAFGSESWQTILMPALTLSLGVAARLARMTRSAMLEVLGQDYIRTGRAKGLADRLVIYRHALKNAAIPVITAFGLQLGFLLSGSVVVEQVFAWPGLGRLMIEAIGTRDIAIIQAGVLWFSMTVLAINLVVDVVYTLVDPRIRYA